MGAAEYRALMAKMKPPSTRIVRHSDSDARRRAAALHRLELIQTPSSACPNCNANLCVEGTVGFEAARVYISPIRYAWHWLAWKWARRSFLRYAFVRLP